MIPRRCFSVLVIGAALIGVLAQVVTLAAQRPVDGDRAADNRSRDDDAADRLWAAARAGDVDQLTRALDEGVAVDAKTAYGSTALCFACDRGHVDIVRILLDRGADPNVQDAFYKATPLTWAQSNGHYETIGLLLRHGAAGADDLLLQAVGAGNVEMAKHVIASGAPSPRSLAIARRQAAAMNSEPFAELFDGLEIPDLESIELTPESLHKFVGVYGPANGAFRATISQTPEGLVMESALGPATPLIPISEHEFIAGSARLNFEFSDERGTRLSIAMGANRLTLTPVDPSAGDAAPSEESPPADAEPIDDETWSYTPSESDLNASSPNWPGFRGIGSRGIADGQHPPTEWDAEAGENLLWKTAIPGLGNSCPTIWGDRLFVTTATSESANLDVRIGQYGNVDSVDDESVYQFTVYCLDKRTGSMIWERTVHSGTPAVKRHSKSSHANPTVATDGRYVVSFFGSEGLYCHDWDGHLVWRKDLGFLDSGWFLDPGYQWGFGSSPTIFEDRVVVQCDIQQESFVAAFDLATGEELWRTSRDEIPSWPSPIVHRFGDMPMLITHGTKAARGYDVRDGTLLWSVGSHSEIVVPTPFVADDLIYLASGYAPVQPIVALRPTARGELDLKAISESEGGPLDSTHIAWSTMRGGPYMPTPIVYGDLLYTCSNNGILTCYRARTGEQLYRERVKIGGTASFTASPLAADGHLYLTAEDGRVAVIRAGERYRLVGVNPCGENVLSTPAISEGVFYLRTLNHLMAFQTAPEARPASRD